MYGHFTLCDYRQPTSPTSVQGYTVSFNCAHVHITKKDEHGNPTTNIVYERESVDSLWFDESHQRIYDAFSALETALLAVIPVQEGK
jgi:hypothetical protein